MKHYRTEQPPNGNNKFNLNLTIKPNWKKGFLQNTKTLVKSSIAQICPKCQQFLNNSLGGMSIP